MRFNENDLIVYPSHGVCKVERKVKKSIGDRETTFVEVKTLLNSLTIIFPIESYGNLSLRPLISKKQANELLRQIKTYTPTNLKATWNRRYRECQEDLRSGDPVRLAQTYKALAIVAKTGNPSFGERKMFEIANGLLSLEFSKVFDVPPEKAEQMLLEAAA